jgi:uncharacterized protein (DUF1330 family)
MPVYLLAEMKLEDRSWIEGYVPPVQALVEKHGGRYVIRAFEYEQIEGERRPDLIVLVEFPSREAARAFYDDPEYEPHRKARMAGSRSDFYLLAGE